jgi:DNA polymerase-3 subunit epsilon
VNVRGSQSISPNPASPQFAAIDFETADYGRDSACALAVVRVDGDRIVDRAHFLIRPPRRSFAFTYLHGISWADVADAPTFRQLWPRIRSSFDGVDFLAAHNAPFDRSVLRACCEKAGVALPEIVFRCTVRLARAVWQLRPTTLPAVCAHLSIPLRHHDALSDAEACARIVIAAAGVRAPVTR